MAIVTYKSLQISDLTITGSAGLFINNNFISIADDLESLEDTLDAGTSEATPNTLVKRGASSEITVGEINAVTGNFASDVEIGGTLEVDQITSSDSLILDAVTSIQATKPIKIQGATSRFTIGNGSDTVFTLTHNYGSYAVKVEVLDTDNDYETIYPIVKRPTDDTVEIEFSSITPTTNQILVLVTLSPEN